MVVPDRVVDHHRSNLAHVAVLQGGKRIERQTKEKVKKKKTEVEE